MCYVYSDLKFDVMTGLKVAIEAKNIYRVEVDPKQKADEMTPAGDHLSKSNHCMDSPLPAESMDANRSNSSK